MWRFVLWPEVTDSFFTHVALGTQLIGHGIKIGRDVEGGVGLKWRCHPSSSSRSVSPRCLLTPPHRWCSTSWETSHPGDKWKQRSAEGRGLPAAGAFIPCAPPRVFVMSIAASSSSPVRGGSTCPGLHVSFVCTVSLDTSGMLSVEQKQSRHAARALALRFDG